TYYPARGVDGQSTDLRTEEHGVSLTIPIVQDERNEWTFTGDASRQDLHSHVILPDSGRRLPSELWDVGFGGNYRHKFDNDWIGAGGVTVGALSDQPFASRHETIVRAIGML